MMICSKKKCVFRNCFFARIVVRPLAYNLKLSPNYGDNRVRNTHYNTCLAEFGFSLVLFNR